MAYADSDVSSSVLAGRTLNRNAKAGTSGTRFLQRSDKVKVHKRESRQRMLELFGIGNFSGHLSILTFPSTNWIFEGMLINNRAGSNKGSSSRKNYHKIGRHTFITSIEREEAVYRSAMNLIPGIKFGIKTKLCPPYATSSIRTYAIKRFLRCSFEDLARSEVSPDCKDLKFNGAWLDFNGPISLSRKRSVEDFLLNHVHNYCVLAITAMDARYDAESMMFWGEDREQSFLRWLSGFGEVVYSRKYQSTVPMIDIAVRVQRN